MDTLLITTLVASTAVVSFTLGSYLGARSVSDAVAVQYNTAKHFAWMEKQAAERLEEWEIKQAKQALLDAPAIAAWEAKQAARKEYEATHLPPYGQETW